MTTALKYGVDKQGLANGLPVPSYVLAIAPFEIATYHIDADMELEIVKPLNLAPDPKDKDNISRVVINCESPTLLAVDFIGGLDFPTAVHGNAVQGLILNAGVLIIPDGVDSIFLRSKIIQNVTVGFYSNSHD